MFVRNPLALFRSSAALLPFRSTPVPVSYPRASLMHAAGAIAENDTEVVTAQALALSARLLEKVARAGPVHDHATSLRVVLAQVHTGGGVAERTGFFVERACALPVLGDAVAGHAVLRKVVTADRIAQFAAALVQQTRARRVLRNAPTELMGKTEEEATASETEAA